MSRYLKYFILLICFCTNTNTYAQDKHEVTIKGAIHMLEIVDETLKHGIPKKCKSYARQGKLDNQADIVADARSWTKDPNLQISLMNNIQNHPDKKIRTWCKIQFRQLIFMINDVAKYKNQLPKNIQYCLSNISNWDNFLQKKPQECSYEALQIKTTPYKIQAYILFESEFPYVIDEAMYCLGG